MNEVGPLQSQTRRGFLKLSAATAGLAGAAALGLSACGTSSSSLVDDIDDDGKTSGPKRGGNLRVGLTGGSSTDTLDPDATVTVPDIARQVTLFEPLVTQNSQDRPALDLAQEVTADNSTATSWTIRLHKGVTFHNGKELTAEDVLYHLHADLEPQEAPQRRSLARTGRSQGHQDPRSLHPAGSDDDARTRPSPPSCTEATTSSSRPASIPRHRSGRALSSSSLANRGCRASSSGTRTTGRRPMPYIDELTIVEFQDATSQVNALVSGEVDAIGNIPLTVAPTLQQTAGDLHPRLEVGRLQPLHDASRPSRPSTTSGSGRRCAC